MGRPQTVPNRRRGGQTSHGNLYVASLLEQMAQTLTEQGANVFHANAYRRAALTVAAAPCDLSEVTAEPGGAVLPVLGGVSPAIAGAIEEILRTGRWVQLDRLRASHDPVRLFQTLPGIAHALARRMQETLTIDSLEALETAILDGRIARVKSLGLRRIAGLKDAVTATLGRLRGPARRPLQREPAVGLLLDADQEFRAKAAAGILPALGVPRPAPRAAGGGVPVLHTERGEWHLTILFAQAGNVRQPGRMRDWSVVYFQDDQQEEGQRTITTETWGDYVGRRGVRGRERECAAARPPGF